MNINHIKEFLVMADSPTFQEAADSCFISQSSLSKHISLLEKELDVPLLDRSSRKAEINGYGRIFLQYGKEICASYSALLEALANEVRLAQNKLSIGAVPSMVQYNITDMITRFQKTHPNYSVDIKEDHSVELDRAMKAGVCELAFIRTEAPLGEEYIGKEYCEDTLIAVVSSQNPLAEKPILSFSDLRKTNLMIMPTHTSVPDFCVESCRRAGFEPSLVSIARRPENIVEMAAQDVGVGLIQRKMAEYPHNRNVVLKEISPTITSRLYLCCLKNTVLSPQARAFWDFMTACINAPADE